ncbi:MAG: PAC2 family protein [Candidatus Woesearchaeota archaeon]
MTWQFTHLTKPKMVKPFMIEGMPGIGNVGKIVADVLIEQLKAKKIIEIFGHKMPNTVFVNEENLVQLPSIEIYYAKHKGKDFVILTGDVQPIDEEGSYSFVEAVLDYAQSVKVSGLITLGGIGLQEIPQKPKVLCTGTSPLLIKSLAKAGADPNVHGKVGPIMGVTGLLLGLGGKRGIPTGSVLAETLAHPMFVGLEGAKQSLTVLNKHFGFKMSFKEMDEEIVSYNKQLKSKKMGSKLDAINELKTYKETSYIG